MAIKGGTICSKHDKIHDFAKEAIRAVESVIDMTEKAAEDGQRMESGLNEKRKQIEKLEAEIEDLNTRIVNAERLIESLQEENRDLADQLKAATATEVAP